MKKHLLSLLSLLLALAMLTGIFASCTGSGVEVDTDDQGNEETSSSTESSSPEDTDKKPDDGNVEGPVANKHDQLIQTANGLANGVQAFFTDAKRTHYSLKNTEMTMNYSRSNTNDQLVESIKNTKGNSYIENTMDVFVRMKSGDTFYASQSTQSAEANLYRFGYYYYEALFEFQNFIPKDYEVSNSAEIDLRSQYGNSYDVNRGRDGDAVSYIITSSADPRIMYDKNFSYSTSEYNVLVLRAKTIGTTNSLELFVKTNSNYNQSQRLNVPLIADGEYHDYYISIFNVSDYTGNVTGLRFDPNGGVGSGIAIESMTMAKADLGDIPSNLSINRHFHVYSDKMHHAVQFATTATTENIQEIGMVTKLATDTVSKLIVVTADGNTYTSLDAGFAWDDVVAVAFDVTGAGIFGYILPNDAIAGKLKVTVDGDSYVIEQTRVPTLADGTEGVIIPSINTEKTDENGNYIHADGVAKNGNDVYLGQRIYTDESHDFAEFLKETDFERHPLSEQRVNVSSTSDNASYGGYDAMRGIYVLNVATPAGGFYTPYNNPNKDYKANFSIRSDVDRDIYVMTAGSGQLLECATLMDEDMMLLPVPIEVIKNFSEATGERNLFNIDDPGFSEAILVLSLDGGEKQEYTIINLYQNWGKYPLKQLSQIPFHCPYYHLSTGVTETNCILPWFGTANVGKSASSTLPDFRSMSAPFWGSQPQHNSCGSHTWLAYTDTEGKYNLTESIVNTITSYGPTYAEVVWENISDDGKIKVTYTHMEMPQTDENRTYYTMEYEFLEDLTINNFKENFRFYNVTDNNAKGTYKKLGYLNEQNEYVVVDSNQDTSAVPEYVLGDNCPYFSFFMMPDWDRESTSAEGYANVALLIASSSFTIGGEAYEPTFLIRNGKDNVTLTLNESGTVSFKAGDKIKINAILLPWGSQELEDDPANRLNKAHATGYTEYTYSTVLSDGTLYMDKNVRDVRENTLLNPLTVTSTTDTVLDSNFLPKVKSKDGKTATFTLSGGENNVAVRIYGFNKLTSPKVQELVDGEWVDYVLSSHDQPDERGNYHYYDGYMVNCDEDGTYSYSFVTTMNGGESRTFRITATDDFVAWPKEEAPAENENFLNVFVDHEELHEIIKGTGHMYGDPVISADENGPDFTSIHVLLENPYGESYSSIYTALGDGMMTGQYLVIKYRVPQTNKEGIGPLQIWSSTFTDNAASAGSFQYTLAADGDWHVDVIDLSKSGLKSYNANADEEYWAKFLRIDFFNKQYGHEDTHIDFAYIGIDSDLEKICALEAESFNTITLVEGKTSSEIDTSTGKAFVKTYIDPSSGYTESNLKFGTIIDSINGVKVTLNNYTVKGGIQAYHGAGVTADMKLTLAGWACVEGGINQYVWSVDGGKTWTPFPGQDKLGDAADAMISNVEGANKVPFSDAEASKTNGNFKSGVCPLIVDLSAYAGQKVDVIVAAIPETAQDTLVLLYSFEKVDCKHNSVFEQDSKYVETNLTYGSQIDSVNSVDSLTVSGTASGYGYISGKAVNENNAIVLKGWACVNGGISKYVWTADGGKTWNDCSGVFYGAHDEMIRVGENKAGATFTDKEATKKNGAFQSAGIVIDLSEYVGNSDSVTVYFCAVPEYAPNNVVILYVLENVDLTK